jgi:hypothetical protein
MQRSTACGGDVRVLRARAGSVGVATAVTLRRVSWCAAEPHARAAHSSATQRTACVSVAVGAPMALPAGDTTPTWAASEASRVRDQ